MNGGLVAFEAQFLHRAASSFSSAPSAILRSSSARTSVRVRARPLAPTPARWRGRGRGWGCGRKTGRDDCSEADSKGVGRLYQARAGRKHFRHCVRRLTGPEQIRSTARCPICRSPPTLLGLAACLQAQQGDVDDSNFMAAALCASGFVWWLAAVRDPPVPLNPWPMRQRHLEANEACDDGNTSDGDDCLADRTLKLWRWIVQLGVEACDDGNTDETDACLSSCLAASCGDGFVQAGVEKLATTATTDEARWLPLELSLREMRRWRPAPEIEECDDGNAAETMVASPPASSPLRRWLHPGRRGGMRRRQRRRYRRCLHNCMRASCGDGHVQVDVERWTMATIRTKISRRASASLRAAETASASPGTGSL